MKPCELTLDGKRKPLCGGKDVVSESLKTSEASMATMYLVQGFQLKGKKLVADAVKPVKTADAAIAQAERLSPSRAGVIAFSQEVDVETDTYDEPRVLFRTGSLPPGLLE